MARPIVGKRAAPRPLEREVQKSIIALLTFRRALVVRTNSGGVKVDDRYVRFNSAKGCSDLLACYRGRWLALEVKRDAKEKPTEQQAAFLAEVARAGGIGRVVSDIREVETILDQIDRELNT